MKQEITVITNLEMQAMQTMAKLFSESGMFTDMGTMAKAFIKIQAGKELGIEPFAAMSGIHIIKGKATIGAGLMAGKVKSSGKYDYNIIEHSKDICKLEFLRDGKSQGFETFTIEDAKKAGTQNLDKFPKNMLFARAISNGVKFFCPDLYTMPVYTPEEFDVEDISHEEIKQVSVELEIQDTKRKDELSSAIAGLEIMETVSELTEFKNSLPSYIVSDASFTDAGKKRYGVIIAEKPTI